MTSFNVAVGRQIPAHYKAQASRLYIPSYFTTTLFYFVTIRRQIQWQMTLEINIQPALLPQEAQQQDRQGNSQKALCWAKMANRELLRRRTSFRI